MGTMLETRLTAEALDRWRDEALRLFDQHVGKPSITAAKQEFLQATGLVFPDDPQFESRMSYFVDWLIFIRKFPGCLSGDTFFDHIGSSGERAPSPFKCGHGLFEALKITSDRLFARRWPEMTKMTFFTHHHDGFAGIRRRDLFQGVYFTFPPNGALLGKGLVFHPPEARKTVLQRLREDGFGQHANTEQHLFALAHLQWRRSRMTHVAADEFYRRPA